MDSKIIRENRTRLRTIEKQGIGWLATLLAALFFYSLFFYSQPLVSNALAESTPTIESVYPGLATGVLQSATLAEMNKGTLLQGDGVEIQASFAERIFGQVTPGIQKELGKNMFFLLEQEATREFIKRDAKAMGISVDQHEKEMGQAYVNSLTRVLTVTEAEARAFYDSNKEMVGGMPFEQVKGNIEQFLLQQKKQEFLDAHIKNLGKKARIRLNRDWVKKQAQLALDNPVDKARMSGKPTMIEFGATGCVPCDMMQPVLKNLRKKYPDKLNVVFVHVGENRILGARFGIQSIPVQAFYDKNGEEVFRHVGFYAEAEVLKQLAKMGVE
ncbi:MAG: thioredoxin family protein [Deltaproteobacteria bacterium]|nr:thioredoxin family protein [Deltaproteobacteria bacterium]